MLRLIRPALATNSAIDKQRIDRSSTRRNRTSDIATLYYIVVACSATRTMVGRLSVHCIVLGKPSCKPLQKKNVLNVADLLLLVFFVNNHVATFLLCSYSLFLLCWYVVVTLFPALVPRFVFCARC